MPHDAVTVGEVLSKQGRLPGNPGSEQTAQRRVELDNRLRDRRAEHDMREARIAESGDDLVGRLALAPQARPPPMRSLHRVIARNVESPVILTD